jgi:CRISPR-associated protein Cmr1
VRKTKNDKLVGVIFHMPHLPPAAFNPNRAAIERAWQQVHALLDHLKYDPPRTYPMIPEVAPVNRRSALKPHLDTVTLERISK